MYNLEERETIKNVYFSEDPLLLVSQVGMYQFHIIRTTSLLLLGYIEESSTVFTKASNDVPL